jgi:hypothetical protein
MKLSIVFQKLKKIFQNKYAMKFSVFNPFTHIAGMKAFAIGLPVILLSSALGYLSHTHFDGVLDAHMSDYGTIYNYITEGLIDFICLFVTFYITGIIISGSHFRFIDLMGTLSLSRAPLIIIALAGFIMPQQKVLDYVFYTFLNKGTPVSITAFDVIGFIVGIIIIILVMIWTVALMFNAYKICVNKKGAKLIVSFIIALFISEVISKILIFSFFPNPLINQILSK